MKFSQIINEAQLSDITMGFEVECILPDNKKVHQPLQDILNKYNIDWDNDSSINPSGKYNQEQTYEFKIGELENADGSTSQMRATPANFLRCANFVHDIFKLGGYTNESCGLHAHFGIGELNKLSNLQNVWFTIYMIQSGILRKKYMEFKGYPLMDLEYASFEYVESSVDDLLNELDNLGDIEQRVGFLYHSLISRRNFEKYSALFPHKQGTIEWRGLRGILDGFIKEDFNTILDFFKLAASFAKDISVALNSFDKIEVAGVTLKQVTDFAHKQGVPADKSAKAEVIKLARSFGFESDLEKKVLTALLENKYFKFRMYNDPDIKKIYMDNFTKILSNSEKYLNLFYNLFDKKIDLFFIINLTYPDIERYQQIMINNFEVDNKTFNLDSNWANAANNNLGLIGSFKNTEFIINDINLADKLHHLLKVCTLYGNCVFYVPNLEQFENTKLYKDFEYVQWKELPNQ